MQEEMRKNTLGSLVENEKKGTIYAKITKSHPYNTIHGGYFDYSLWIGKILDCKATKEFGDSDTTIETLETAIQYFHYGDQITIVSFEKLVDKVQDFRVFPGKGECLQVSHLYVLDVLELKEKKYSGLYYGTYKSRILEDNGTWMFDISHKTKRIRGNSRLL